MKAHELIDETIEHAEAPVAVELANGQRISLDGCYHSTNERGQTVLVLVAKGHRKQGVNTGGGQ